MNESVRLDLRTPLYFIKSQDLQPFSYNNTNGCRAEKTNFGGYCSACEQLFCFTLDPLQKHNIEPNREHFLGSLVFSACSPGSDTKAAKADCRSMPETETVLLPPGIYLIAQERQALGKEACIDMAIEQHKDGLWERYVLSDCLYIRYLKEDGTALTQIFRPLDR